MADVNPTLSIITQNVNGYTCQSKCRIPLIGINKYTNRTPPRIRISFHQVRAVIPCLLWHVTHFLYFLKHSNFGHWWENSRLHRVFQKSVNGQLKINVSQCKRGYEEFGFVSLTKPPFTFCKLHKGSTQYGSEPKSESDSDYFQKVQESTLAPSTKSSKIFACGHHH